MKLQQIQKYILYTCLFNGCMYIYQISIAQSESRELQYTITQYEGLLVTDYKIQVHWHLAMNDACTNYCIFGKITSRDR